MSTTNIKYKVDKGQLAFAVIASLACWALLAWGWKSVVTDKKTTPAQKAKVSMQLCGLTMCVLFFTIGSTSAAYVENKS